MGISKRNRQNMIIDILKKSDGATGTKLAEKFAVTRGTILRDIAELRRRGYPIQVSSMVEESGTMVAQYEIPRYLKSTSAASAGRH